MKHSTKHKVLIMLLLFLATTTITFAQKFTGLTATASTGTASAAVDNDMGTRWESAFEDPQWIVVDLGEVKTVGAVKLYWEGANAKDYSISFSSNGTDFTGDIFYTNKAAGTRTDVIDNLNIDCRYIKVNGTARNLTYGYSIWEFEVYPPVTPVLTSLSLIPATSVITLGQTQQLTVGGLDQLGNPFTLTNTTVWSVDGTGASVDANGLFSSTAKGLYTVTATNTSLSKSVTVDVLPSNDNLSLGATATASSGTASAAIDNDGGTRWESAASDPQWIMIDLGVKKHITDFYITWEAANSKDYIIEISDNGTDWTTAVTKTNMAEGTRIDRIYDVNVDGRYVRLTGTARNLTYGHSIWEFKIFGTSLLSTLSTFPQVSKFVTVYPNPVTDKLCFSQEITLIKLFSVEGKEVLSAKNSSSLNVSNLNKGFYLIQLENANGQLQIEKIQIR